MNRCFCLITILVLAMSFAACEDETDARDSVLPEPEDVDTDTFTAKYNAVSYPVCFVACDANEICNTMFGLSFIDMDKCIRNSCDPNEGRWRCDATCAPNAYNDACDIWNGCTTACQKEDPH